eukprot:5416446-Amphidinium_carterae.1
MAFRGFESTFCVLQSSPGKILGHFQSEFQEEAEAENEEMTEKAGKTEGPKGGTTECRPKCPGEGGHWGFK